MLRSFAVAIVLFLQASVAHAGVIMDPHGSAHPNNVILHELLHTIGLDHTTDPNSYNPAPTGGVLWHGHEGLEQTIVYSLIDTGKQGPWGPMTSIRDLGPLFMDDFYQARDAISSTARITFAEIPDIVEVPLGAEFVRADILIGAAPLPSGMIGFATFPNGPLYSNGFYSSIVVLNVDMDWEYGAELIEFSPGDLQFFEDHWGLRNPLPKVAVPEAGSLVMMASAICAASIFLYRRKRVVVG